MCLRNTHLVTALWAPEPISLRKNPSNPGSAVEPLLVQPLQLRVSFGAGPWGWVGLALRGGPQAWQNLLLGVEVVHTPRRWNKAPKGLP